MLDGSWSNWVPPDVTITRQVRYVRHVRGQLDQKLGSPDVTITRQVSYVRNARWQLEQPGFPLI